MNDPAFNLAMAARVGDSWYTHLPAVEAAMAEQDRIDSIRTEAGWTVDEGGWYSPEGIHESDWEHEEGYPLPEDPAFAEWASAFYHYEALDNNVPNPFDLWNPSPNASTSPAPLTG